MKCPACGSRDVRIILDVPEFPVEYECRECGKVFDKDS